MRLISCVLLYPMLAACTFSVPQFESGVRFVKSLTEGESGSAEQIQSRWLASVGSEGAVVMPYTSEGLIVFANANGDAITFDGWTIRSIIGFGMTSPVSAFGREGTRKIFVGDSENSLECKPWLFADGVWSQACDSGDGSITIDEDGNIQRIVMPLTKSLGIVTLQVAN